jgi:hypothetical protein
MMPKEESPLQGLSQFLPPGAYEAVAPYFREYAIHLTLTRHRQSLHGDYRPPDARHPYHRISVNATLNPFSFLVTLLHELAHLTTTVRHGLRVAPHGKEWKSEFRQVLLPYLGKGFFPDTVEQALSDYLKDPAASTCGDPGLYKALARFNKAATSLVHVDDIADGQCFELDGRRFLKLEKLRSRARCQELASGRIYFVQGVALAKLMDE